MRFVQRTPLRLFNDYNKLRLTDLTTNRIAGAMCQSTSTWILSDRSGVRISPGAPKKTKGPQRGPFFFSALDIIRTQSSTESRSDSGRRRRPEGVRAAGPNQSLRARQLKKGSHRGPFFILCVLDEDEDCCSTKRVSVLDAGGAPQG